MEQTPLVSLKEFFQVQFDSIRAELSEMAVTLRATFAETRKTNGRVNELERVHAEHASRVRNLEREVFRGGRRSLGVVTMRDVYLVLGTVGATAAVVKWLPALLAIGKVAP